ncbi:putative reverse transcriptase domain-containing protein, partial [Tanacetum coccineum]
MGMTMENGNEMVMEMETTEDLHECVNQQVLKTRRVVGLISALTWWNSHKRTIGTDAAYALSWRELMKLMTEVYCPRNESKRWETRAVNQSEKTMTSLVTPEIPELTMMCTKMVPEEKIRVTNPTTPTQRGQIVNQRVVTCFECGAQGHYRKDCPKNKNQNRGNKERVPDASGRAISLGG